MPPLYLLFLLSFPCFSGAATLLAVSAVSIICFFLLLLLLYLLFLLLHSFFFLCLCFAAIASAYNIFASASDAPLLVLASLTCSFNKVSCSSSSFSAAAC